MAVAAEHPRPEQITAYAHGKLAEAESAVVEAHLASCEECSRRLQHQPDDSLSPLVRSGSENPAAADDTVLNAATLPPQQAPVDATLAMSPVPDGVPPELLSHPRYRVDRVLGRGGMGAVYLARHLKMQRSVALKVVNAALLDHPTALPRFEQEVRAAARLDHPNIVRAHDADVAGGLHFLVMEYVEGTDLARLIEQQGALPVPTACDMVRQAALGLQHAHEQGMVHRDIKPHNLMLTRTGQVKILDFGLASLARDQERREEGQLTGTGTVMGTADYIAPEQTRDSSRIDIRADVYSLGCTLYQLLSGRVPFPEGSTIDKMIRHALDAPPPLAALRPDLPPALVDAVEKMMAKEPADRYQTPAEVAAALEPFTRQEPGPRLVRARPRWPVAVAAAVVLALVGLAAVVYRIQTDQGEVVVTAESPDVEVTFSQGGKVVTVLDTKTGKKMTLPTGAYDVAIKDKPDDWELKTDRVVIGRGKETLVTIERVKKGDAPRPAEPVARPPEGKEIEALRRDPWLDATVGTLAFSPDGQFYLAAGSGFRGSSARLMETATGKPVQEFPHLGGVISAAITADNKQILTTHTEGLRISDVRTAKETGRLPLEGFVQIGLTADGKRVVLHGETEQGGPALIKVREVPGGREVFRVTPLQDKSLLLACPRLSPDGKHAVTGDFLEPGKGAYRLFDGRTGKEEKTVRVNLGIDHFDLVRNGLTVHGVAVDPEAKRAVIAAVDMAGGTVKKVNLPTDFPGSKGTAFTADGRYFITLHSDLSQVRVHDVATGKLVFKDLIANPTDFSLAVSRDGKTFAVGARGGVHLYRLP